MFRIRYSARFCIVDIGKSLFGTKYMTVLVCVCTFVCVCGCVCVCVRVRIIIHNFLLYLDSNDLLLSNSRLKSVRTYYLNPLVEEFI